MEQKHNVKEEQEQKYTSRYIKQDELADVVNRISLIKKKVLISEKLAGFAHGAIRDARTEN